MTAAERTLQAFERLQRAMRRALAAWPKPPTAKASAALQRAWDAVEDAVYIEHYGGGAAKARQRRQLQSLRVAKEYLAKHWPKP